MTDFALVSHPDFPGSAIRSVEVTANRGEAGRLDLEYRVVGVIADVRWPEWQGVEQADRLWEHSCVEAFVRAPDAAAYVEYNFATSGQLAAYAFDDYRQGMRPVAATLIVGGRTFSESQVTLRRSVRVAELVDMPVWRLGLSAIIETTDGRKSYWALAHPPGKPDFHNEVCFAAQLAAPEPA